MRLINASVRGNTPADMLGVETLSVRAHAGVKRLARKQLRARERQHFLHAVMQDLLDRDSCSLQPPAVASKPEPKPNRPIHTPLRARNRVSLVRLEGADSQNDPVYRVFASCAA